MLEVALRHRFGGPQAGARDGFALDVAFRAPTPGVTVLFGPSGCGKSTVLAAVAGLLRPDAGRIALDGEALLDTSCGIAVPAERRRCGVVFQDARLFPHLSVLSNLRFGMRRAERRAPGDATGPSEEEVVALLGIGGLLGRRPRDLSGGERQRVALGRALLARPRLLLMDEPLASLDAARRAEVLPFLARLRDAVASAAPGGSLGAHPSDMIGARSRGAGVPILYVTHALEEVDALADTLVLMEGGRMLASGPVEKVAARTDLPLAARRDAGVLLPCAVAGHDPGRGLTRLSFAGGELSVPLRGEAPGVRVRVRVRARDVSVATVRPEAISVGNVLPAIVAGVEAVPGSPHEAYLRLAVGPTTILGRVTRDALGRLSLAPGAAVWALVKAVAFQGASREEGAG